jgi:tetratricopeptide (TPR) repeat protein
MRQAYDAALARPEDPEAVGHLGMVLQAYNRWEDAERSFLRADLLAPQEFRWRYYYGYTQASQGKCDEAVVSLKQALGIRADYIPAKLKMAECYRALGNWNESARWYRDVKSQDAANPDAFYGLGRAQVALGDLNGGVASLLRAIELYPEFGAAHYSLGLAYRQMGRNEDAQREFAVYERHKLDGPPAHDELLDAVRTLNHSATFQLRQGVDLERAGKLEEAAQAHEKALEIDPGLVQAHVNLISIYGRLGEPQKAEQHYRAAVRVESSNVEAHYDYGVLLFGLGRSEESEHAFRAALASNPLHADAHHNLGVLLEQQGRLDEAVAEYREAIANRPGFRLAQFHLGRLLVNQRQFQEGIQNLLKTVAEDDESTPTYLYAVGAAYARSGDYTNAVRYLQSARDRAQARGQAQLLASIERDLKAIHTEPPPR